jgi:predicted oxidoreductase
LFKPAGGSEKIERLQRMLLELGKRHGGATVDQIAYAWLLAHPAKVHPILGTNDIDRISSAVKAMDIKLTRQEWFAILEASNGKRVP